MKFATRVSFVVIGWSLLAALVYAQPQPLRSAPQGMTLKKLPQGMTQQELQQRLSPAVARLKVQARNQSQQNQLAAKAIIDATVNERAAVNAVLGKDPRYKAFVEQAQKISAGPGTNDSKAQQLRALVKGNPAIFNDAVKAAKIDPNALQNKLRAIVPGITLTPDLAVRKAILQRHPFTGIVGAQPKTKEIILLPPFTFEEFEADNGGIAASSADGDSNAQDGKAKSKSSVLGVAGGASALAIFGEFVNVPAGVKRVEFTIVAKTSYSGEALGVIGAAIASILVGVEVQNEAAMQVKNDLLDDTVIAPLAWFAEMEGGRTSEVKLAFDVPAKGGDYLVTGVTSALSHGGGVPGYAKAESRSEIDKITVKLFYQ